MHGHTREWARNRLRRAGKKRAVKKVPEAKELGWPDTKTFRAI
jgi:hypothetical protein